MILVFFGSAFCDFGDSDRIVVILLIWVKILVIVVISDRMFAVVADSGLDFCDTG